MRRRLAILSAALAVTTALAVTMALPGAPAWANRNFLLFFNEWSAEIDPAAQDVVAAASAYARENPAMRVDVVGFASNTGSPQANLYLSLLRAQLVSDRLAAAGVAPDRISRVGEGSVTPVGTAEEARRVEIVVRSR